MPNQDAVVLTGIRGSVGSALIRHLRGKAPLALLGREAALPLDIGPGDRIAAIGDVDVLNENSLRVGVDKARAQLGRCRALVHTVGSWVGGVDVGTQSVDSFAQLLELNYLSAVRLIKVLLPDITASKDGRIILFASADAFRGHAGAAAYGAAKAALLRFAEALSEELSATRVCVQVLAPTIIDTAQNRAAMPNANYDHWVTPEEIANTVEFLLSPQSSGIRFAAIPMGR